MTNRLAELRRVIEGASEAALVKNALAEAAGLDVMSWQASEWAEWLSFLLDVVMPGWLSCLVASERTSYFDAFFMRCQPLDALTAVHTYLSREGVSGEGMTPLVDDIVVRVPALIRDASQQASSSSMWHLTLTALFSLPERLANRTKRVPQSLHPSSFADSVVQHALTIGGEQAPIPSLVGALLGYAIRLGHSGSVAAHLLAQPSSIASQLCVCLPESSLQSILASILQTTPSSSVLTLLLSPLFRHSALAAHLLSRKFILTRVFPAPAPGSLVSLIVANSKRAAVLDRVASVWSDTTFLHQQLALQTYITEALLALLKSSTREEAESSLASILQGVQRHLSSALSAVRTQGMRVAETLSAIATPDAPLKFDDNNDNVKSIVEEDEMKDDESKTEESKPPVPAPTRKAADGPDDPDRLVLDCETADDQADDEEEDLKPYDLRDDDALGSGSAEKPTYIRELVSVLTVGASPETAQTRIEAAMSAAPDIIRASVHELPALAETLFSALLQVPEATRGKALQALLVSWPPSAAALIRRLYEPNFALTTRGAMLDALIDAAHELSALPKSEAVPREGTVADSRREQEGEASKLRIVGQVRRWASQRRAPAAPVQNRFEAAVPHFFQPLMAKAENALKVLQVFSDDSSLLARLVYAAGTFVVCAGSGSVHIERMTDSLLQFLWSLRFVPSIHLRRALLISAWHVFSTVPPTILHAWLDRIDQWRTYLESVATDDPDDESRLLAQYNLSTLHGSVQSGLLSSE